MFSKSKPYLLFFLFMILSTNLFAQLQSEKWGLGASAGFKEKVSLGYNLSERSQISFEIGNFAFSDDSFQIGNLGIGYKYFFRFKTFSSYFGFNAAIIETTGPFLYLHIPFGIQKFVTKDLTVFAGFNPGVVAENGADFLIAVELGAMFYF